MSEAHRIRDAVRRADPTWKTERDRAQADALGDVIAELNNGIVANMGRNFCALACAVTLAVTGGVNGWLWAVAAGCTVVGFVLASVGRTSVVLDGLESRKRKLEGKG